MRLFEVTCHKTFDSITIYVVARTYNEAGEKAIELLKKVDITGFDKVQNIKLIAEDGLTTTLKLLAV